MDDRTAPPLETSNSDSGALAIRANRLLYWLSRRWLLIFVLLVGTWVGLPWLAPIFMKLGWTRAGELIYLLYAPQCHQLPQRSFFLFGSSPMYGLGEIQAVWQDTNNPVILRQFLGNPAMGWKVAWSDRMVSLYTGILLWAVVFWPLRKRLPSLPRRALALMLLPMILDGVTHMISDLASGIGVGFRDSNLWLSALTNDVLPAAFYAGDSFGSFNSWMRLITGLLFSLGVVWWAYPVFQRSFDKTARQIEEKFRQADLSIS